MYTYVCVFCDSSDVCVEVWVLLYFFLFGFAVFIVLVVANLRIFLFWWFYVYYIENTLTNSIMYTERDSNETVDPDEKAFVSQNNKENTDGVIDYSESEGKKDGGDNTGGIGVEVKFFEICLSSFWRFLKVFEIEKKWDLSAFEIEKKLFEVLLGVFK